MAKKLKGSAAAALLITAVLSVWYKITLNKAILSATITFGTTAYHLVMRLMVGFIFNLMMDNKADYTRRRYQVSRQEMQLYGKLKVKSWKTKLPTYYGALFDPGKHSWEEIAQAMCQAELVHETIAVLSFFPIAAGLWFGDYPVFIITSMAAALVDMLFVITQRYNRGRVMALLKKSKNDRK